MAQIPIQHIKTSVHACVSCSAKPFLRTLLHAQYALITRQSMVERTSDACLYGCSHRPSLRTGDGRRVSGIYIHLVDHIKACLLAPSELTTYMDTVPSIALGLNTSFLRLRLLYNTRLPGLVMPSIPCKSWLVFESAAKVEDAAAQLHGLVSSVPSLAICVTVCLKMPDGLPENPVGFGRGTRLLALPTAKCLQKAVLQK